MLIINIKKIRFQSTGEDKTLNDCFIDTKQTGRLHDLTTKRFLKQGTKTKAVWRHINKNFPLKYLALLEKRY